MHMVRNLTTRRSQYSSYFTNVLDVKWEGVPFTEGADRMEPIEVIRSSTTTSSKQFAQRCARLSGSRASWRSGEP